MADVTLLKGTPFIGAQTEMDGARVVLFGMPFDSTTSFRPGARFGPMAIRQVSDVLETFCPRMRLDLDDIAYADVGDLLLPPGDSRITLDTVYGLVTRIVAAGQMPAGLGGEHLLSLPIIKAVHERHPDLCIVHFDAHMDMRTDYLGVELSHASVMRKVTDFLDPSRLLQIGPRSGTRDEFDAAARLGNLRGTDTSPEEIRQWVGERPLYVTVDLDVLDPSVFPGTGTPEPGGVAFNTLQNWLIGLKGCRFVGWDVMELAPAYDASQVSSIVAAKIVRTLLLASTESTGPTRSV
jgi:agmatinase